MDSDAKTMEKLKFVVLRRSLKSITRVLLDDCSSIQGKIHAMEDAGYAIRCATQESADNDIEVSEYPDFNAYFEALVVVLSKPMSEDNVCKVLENVYAAFCPSNVDVEPGDNFEVKYCASAATIIPELCAVTIKIFIKYRNKPAIVKFCDNIFDYIFCEMDSAEDRSKCWAIVVESGFVSIVTSVITTNSNYAVLPYATSTEELCKYALHILYNLTLDQPEMLSWVLVETAPPVFHCMLSSNDFGTLITGCAVISEFLLQAADEMITLSFKDGKTGLQYLLLVIMHCLKFINAPENAEVGYRLRYSVLKIIKSLARSKLETDVDRLLKMALNLFRKWQATEMVERLLVIFANLINTECEAVLKGLSKAGPRSGQNSLRNIIANGLCKHYQSFRPEDQTTVDLALLRIYEYGVEHPESQLKGENLEAVRALLLTLEISDAEEKDPVAQTLWTQEEEVHGPA